MIQVSKIEPLREQVRKVSEVLKLMSHPERLSLLCLLSQQDYSVGQLQEKLGMGQSQISQSLQKLELMKIVSYKRVGKYKYYQVIDAKIKSLIECLYEIYCKENI